ALVHVRNRAGLLAHGLEKGLDLREVPGVVAAVTGARKRRGFAPLSRLSLRRDAPGRRIVDGHEVATANGEFDFFRRDGERTTVVQVQRADGSVLENERDSVRVSLLREGKHRLDVAKQ